MVSEQKIKTTHNISSIDVDNEVIVEAYNIGIIDDSKFNRGAIRSRLPANKLVVTIEGENDESILKKFKSLPERQIPNLVIVGGDSNFDNSCMTVEWLTKNYRNIDIKIIFFSETNDKEKLLKILKLGVNSILNIKQYDPDDIESEIYKVLKGGRKYSFDDHLIEIMLDSLVIKKDFSDDKVFNESINERDKQIIQMIIQEKKSVEISEELNLSVRTVENIINSLISKFEVKNRVGLVIKAYKKGLLD